MTGLVAGAPMTGTVAAVVIGRNEGDRLQRCLASLSGACERIVYVDSGSSDRSVAMARAMGTIVVELDTASPFTAARARNAGFDALRPGGLTDHVQFVDGDCWVEPGWIAAAVAALDQQPQIGIITGWRTEIAPHRNIFHRMSEVEWHRPAGDIASCGGDMMVRSTTFAQLDGFRPRIIASEDEEFCLRMRALGPRVHRLPRLMTRHDADMDRLAQWWRRTVRSGHGFAEVGGLHPVHFVAERRRVWFYGGLCPAVLLAGLVTGVWPVVALSVAAYALNWLRTAQGLLQSGQPRGHAAHMAALLTLSKIANMQGMLTYYLRRWRGADMQIIEYK